MRRPDGPATCGRLSDGLSYIRTRGKLRCVGVKARESTMEYPDCKKCNVGLLLPLSDYGRDGASIRYKAWVCHNPECGFSIRIDNGEISLGKDLRESLK